MSAPLWKNVSRSYWTNVELQAASTLEDRIGDSPTLSLPCRLEFLNQCWDLQATTIGDDSAKLQPYQSYLQHYEECCVNDEYSNDLKSFSHRDFSRVVECLSHNTAKPYRDVADMVRSLCPSLDNEQAIKACVNFVGRAILLLNLKDWSPDESLKDFTSSKTVPQLSQQDRFQLPLSFNARSFKKIAGIDIKWERDLFNHLSTDHEMDSLRIFRHAQVLDLYEGSRLSSIFPHNFLTETRETMALLLPPNNRASREWFKREQQKYHLENAVGRQSGLKREHRHIQHFKFWRDRLIIAKEIYDTSQPSNLAQFWRDDRNPVQWWTFWIAGVVFILTLISVIEGALQVYKAYYPSI